MPGLSLRLGDVLAGRYRLEELVGCEASGVTLHARQVHGREPVTVEVLAGYSDADRTRIEERIARARVAAHFASPHVARVLDIGKTPDGMPFVVTTRMAGPTLDDALARTGRFPLATAVDLAMQVCGALAEAHAYGLVHGDVEPKRIVLATAPDGAPFVSLMGSGVASAIDALGEASASTWIGSPSYIAPEQARSEPVDTRADLWSVGVLLHELVSGAPPFEGESASAVLVSVAFDAAPLLTDAPLPLAKIVAQCLAKNPNARPATAEALAELLAPYAGPGGARRLAEVRATGEAARRRVVREAARDAARAKAAGDLALAPTMRMAMDGKAVSPMARTKEMRRPPSALAMIGNPAVRGSAPPPARQVKHLAPVLLETDRDGERDSAEPLPLVRRRELPTTASRRVRAERRAMRARATAIVVIAAALGCVSAAWASGPIRRVVGKVTGAEVGAAPAVQALDARVDDGTADDGSSVDVGERAPIEVAPFRPSERAATTTSATGGSVPTSALPDAPASAPAPRRASSRPTLAPSPYPASALPPADRHGAHRERLKTELFVRTPPWPSGPAAGSANAASASKAPASSRAHGGASKDASAARLFEGRK